MIMMKKRLFKFLALVLSLIFSLQALSACKEEENTLSETTETHEVTQPSTSTPGEYSGYLNDYALVRGGLLTCREAVNLGVLLEEALSVAIGTEVKAQVDTRSKDSTETKEILFGITNRSASKKAIEALQKDEFSVTVDGNKIVIVGENPLALKRAIKYFIDHCIYGIASASELKDYREQRKDEAIELSELSEFKFTDPTYLYQSDIQQDFAIDWATGDIYYSAHGVTSSITRVTPSGHREFMICNNFGHMETMEIERVGDKVYIWTTSHAGSLNGVGKNDAISRFEFIPGATYEWEAGQTFELKDGKINNYPCIDLENRIVGNWTGSEMYVYDMDLLLAGKEALLTIVNVAFPFEGYTKRIGCGFDISGSYLYGGFYWERGTEYGMYVVEFDFEGNVTNWTSITYQPEEFVTYGELNGIKVERINGVNHVFFCLAYNATNINRRYCPVVGYFSERKLDPVTPTMDSLPLMTQMIYTELPILAKETPWTCSNSVFSVQSGKEQRLLFNEGGFLGESYSLETTVTMNGAEYAGIAIAAATCVSNVDSLYFANEFIGAKITVSNSGVLKIEAYSATKTYDVDVGNSFKIKCMVDEEGKLTVYIDAKKIAEIQLPNDPNKYVGGHVGCLAKGGTVSFSDTILTYYQS